MADITIGIVASSREWRSVLQAHVRDHVADVRVQILREPRMALELDLDVVVIDDVSSFLTRDKVVRLREKGTRVVGIYDPEGQEGLGQSFLDNLGVDLALPSTISPEEMINAVSQLQPRQNYSHTFDHAVADFTAESTIVSDPGDSTLIAVSGPSGTGSTEVAIALADVLVARRNATLLMDCDEVGPSIARRLGFHLHPNILSAMDAVANVTKPMTEMVGRPSDRAASSVNFDVIPGIANPEDWSQLRSMEMSDLFTAARKSWRYIVCNTGAFAEDLSGYGMERFGATRATLEHADVIIGVMSPTPTGYMRFLDWMASLRTVGHDRAVFVVVNHAPKSNYVRGEIENQLSRDVDSRYLAGLHFISDDERVVKAEWEGQLVSRGPFVTGVAEVATYAVPMQQQGRRAKKGSAAPVVVQPHVPQQGGYSTGFETMAPPPVAPQQVSVSWDDPDIAHPPVQQAPRDPAEFFESQQPLDVGIQDIEASLAEVMQEHDNAVQQAAPETETYSYSPPAFSTEPVQETVTPAVPTTVEQPQVSPSSAQQVQPGDQGYVPAFKRGAEDPTPDQFITSQAPPPAVETGQYTSPPVRPQQDGYVPGFVEQEEEEQPDDNKFWGQ